MDDFPVNQIETGDNASTATADAEAVHAEITQNTNGTEQASGLEKLVETILEEQNNLRKSNEELLTKNHELETSLQQLQGETSIAFCFSVASLIISFLAITAFIILRNKLLIREKHLERELYIEEKSSGEKISCSEKISELSQAIQRLNLTERELSVEDKQISELHQEIQRLNSLVTNIVQPPPSPQPQLPLSPQLLNFTEEFNALMSRKESAIFSTEFATFIRKYRIRAFSCSNSQELIQDSTVTPIFKEDSTDDRADYWAYENGDSYEVVPSPYVQSYNDSVNIGRAFDKVFESNFEFGEYFTDIHVEKPALFKKSGVQWILQTRGKLLLR